MPARVTCPSCGTHLQCPDGKLEQYVRCPTCRRPFKAHADADDRTELPPAPDSSRDENPPHVKAGSGRKSPSKVEHLEEIPEPDLPKRKRSRDAEDFDREAEDDEDDEELPPSRRRRRSRRREDDDAYERPYYPPPKRKGPSVLLILGGIGFICLLACCGFGAFMEGESKRAGEGAIQAANAKYASGNFAEAIAEYKRYFKDAPNKSETLKRIVEYEARKGDTKEMQEWIARGVEDGVGVSYDHPAAVAYLTESRKEHAERARAGINMENYERIRQGMHVNQVEKLLGSRGSEAASAEGMSVVTYSRGGKVISITYEHGFVSAKAQFGL